MSEKIQEQAKLGAVIKTLRTISGMTRKELAKRADISENYVVGIEEGRNSPSQKTFEKIAKALQISPASLSMFEDEPDEVIELGYREEVVPSKYRQGIFNLLKRIERFAEG